MRTNTIAFGVVISLFQLFLVFFQQTTSEKRYFDLVHLLLEHGACVDARNANGRSALALTNDAMLINSGAKADDFANLLVQLQSHSKPELADSMSANKEDALERHRSDERLLRQRSKQARVAGSFIF